MNSRPSVRWPQVALVTALILAGSFYLRSWLNQPRPEGVAGRVAASPGSAPTETAPLPQSEATQAKAATSPHFSPVAELAVTVERTPSVAGIWERREAALPHGTASRPRRQALAPRTAPIAGLVAQQAAVPSTPPNRAGEASGWPTPLALIRLLDALEGEPRAEAWTAAVRRDFQQLAARPALDDAWSAPLLARLRQQQRYGYRLAETLPTDAARILARRASYDIEKRVDLWAATLAALRAEQLPATAEPTHPRLMVTAVRDVQRLIASGPGGDRWRRHLLLDELVAMAVGESTPRQRAEIAWTVLSRLDRSRRGEKQRQWLAQESLILFDRQLRRWARQPSNVPALLAAVEEYEDSASALAHAALVEHAQILRWTEGPYGQVGQALDAHWRNGNVRISIAEPLVNRLIPEMPPMSEPVREEIVGAAVAGSSVTVTQVRVDFLPDRDQGRIDLETRGLVASETAASKGPVTFYNQGRAEFCARKLLLLGSSGVSVWDAQAAVRSRTDTIDLETDLDWLPIVGQITRAVAVQQRDAVSAQAEQEVEARISAKARGRIDREVGKQLLSAQHLLRRKVLDPLSQLNLDPVVLQAETTNDRLILRGRLAGHDHLGGNTPRPQAPADSLASVQCHQSAMNNYIDRFELDGHEFALPALFAQLAESLKLDRDFTDEPLPDDVTIEFANPGAVRVRFEEGKARLELRFASLRQGNTAWRNFEVYVDYHPIATANGVRLEREGIVQLGGRRLGFRSQIALRAIFSKVFSKNRSFILVKDVFQERPALRGLQITQLELADGWLGVAVGPRGQNRPVITRARSNLLR